MKHSAAARDSRQVMAGNAIAWLGFLSPEDVVPWKEPAELKRWMCAELGSGDDESAFRAANRLSLEAFRVREAGTATAVCEQEIAYAAARLAREQHGRTAMLGLQPVVNLIRLNGYSADLALARHGLAELERIADGEPVTLLGLELGASLTRAIGADSTRLTYFARANCLIETAKILWRRGLVDEMLAQCARMMRKWPRTSVSGPYHALEAAWLTGPPAPTSAQSLPLRRLLALHALAWYPDLEGAHELFRSRLREQPDNSLAAARQAAALGDTLIRLGDNDRGDRCFGEAHTLAATADPVLANLIRSHWLELTGQPERMPATLLCPRLSRDDLAELSALAAIRFRH